MTIVQRLFRGLTQSNLASRTSASTATKGLPSRRIPIRYQRHRHNNAYLARDYRKNGVLEVAKFALLSIATLPFTLWLAMFSYDYYYRVELCLEALKQEDKELRIRLHKDKQSVVHRGREAQLNQVKTLLSKVPHQVVLVAGVNECGKSQFVSEVLRDVNSSRKEKRGVTHIQLAQLVDSVSSFTYMLVNSFNLQWLSLRYSLVDVLPFAGSEILVMKERFSDRDLASALYVITEALKKHSQRKSKEERPIIVIDGLAEGKSWARTQEGKQCLERLFQWCIYVTKERQLAHIILTGNEELVLSLTDQNRLTRGHVKVIGLGDLQKDEARQVVLKEIPDASEEEVQKILDAFGGFIHDVRGSARDIQDQLGLPDSLNAKERARIVQDTISTRCRMQFERVTAAFAKGHDELDVASNRSTDDAMKAEEMDPYLDPLKAAYSEAQASQTSAALSDSDYTVSYTKLQLWQTLQMLVDAKDGAVAFAELRDNIFNGDQAPLLELMDDDVLGFEIEDSQRVGFSWKVKPATPALYGAFQQIVSDSSLKERFQLVEKNSDRQDEIREVVQKRMKIRKERKELEERKGAIQSTVELGEKLDRKGIASSKLTAVYEALVREEHDALVRDYELREKLKSLEQTRQVESPQTVSKTENEVQQHLKTAMLQIMTQNLSNEDSSLEGFDGNSALWAAFQELDATKDGTFAAEDVVRVIKAYTGKDVKLKDARNLVRDWDFDNDKHIDIHEFTRWYSSQDKQKKTKAKT
ncbi:unnamed protein product [Cylindrotheca closterium]|uniref:EF-hand domain-containing protein n=1 Tax=Cylindrotheca closterium TaxID=2856 RepID=A0AAD2G6J4_9STRA|nr:unnamed protein product [Cylindrotheca closterium]